MCRWRGAAGTVVMLAMVASARAGEAPQSVESGGLAITLVMVPSPPVRHERTTFEVLVRDTGGTAVAGAHIILDLTMPGRAVAQNRPHVEDRGGGRYVGVGTFTVSGEWRAVVIALQGGGHARAEFPVQVR